MESKKFKLDIFEVLRNISNSNTSYWNSLTEEQQKAFQPLVVMRWLTSNDKFELYMIDNLVNKFVFTLGEHKQLLYNLMSISTIPNSRYSWIKRSKKELKYPKTITALSIYLDESKRESKDNLQFYSNADILEIISELGYQKEDIAAIKKELKTRNV